MGIYKSKPTQIEAMQWDGSYGNAKEIIDWAGVNDGTITFHDGAEFLASHLLRVHTLRGIMKARKGDFIVKGIKGEFYSHKPDIFHATYEEILLEESDDTG